MKLNPKNRYLTRATGNLLSGSLLVAAIAGALAAVPAHAVDTKIYAGSMCQEYTNAYNTNLTRDAVGLYNSSYSSNAWVSCPVTRDNTTNKNGTYGSYVFVNQYSGTSQRFYCAIYSRDTWGNSVESRGASLSSSQTGKRWLYLDTSKSAYKGAYHYLCKVPPRSRIYTIAVDEH